MSAKGGCAAFGCVVVVAVGLAAIAGLWTLLPELAQNAEEVASTEPQQTEEVESPPLPARPPRGRRETPAEPGDPDRAPVQDRSLLRLSFRFTDHGGHPHRATCAVRRADYEREVASFGVVPRQLWERVDTELQAALEAEAEARGVGHLFSIRVTDKASYSWRYPTPGSRDLAARAQAFHDWLNGDAREVAEQILARAYQEHGFHFDHGSVSVDYTRIIRDGTGPLADCYRALRRVDPNAGAGALASLFLAFFQELRYEIPPDPDARGRVTLGFRVPTGVLVERAGDCDSKAAAFCSVWRQLPARVLMVMVPNHALVAVEARPGPDQAYVRLGNRYYVFCEVAGPGKAPPGVTSVSGHFEYLLIEPAS